MRWVYHKISKYSFIHSQKQGWRNRTVKLKKDRFKDEFWETRSRMTTLIIIIIFFSQIEDIQKPSITLNLLPSSPFILFYLGSSVQRNISMWTCLCTSQFRHSTQSYSSSSLFSNGVVRCFSGSPRGVVVWVGLKIFKTDGIVVVPWSKQSGTSSVARKRS